MVLLAASLTGAVPVSAQTAQADLAKKQELERQDWQQRGVGGMVMSVDSASGTIVLLTGAWARGKTIAIHTNPTTVLKRYAPASVRYDLAQVAPIDAIYAGDQLRARGTRNATGTEMTADEVISGTFRIVSGLIVSIDTTVSSVVVKDLATLKLVTVKFAADTQMRQLPESAATMLAEVLNGNAGGGGGGGFDAQQMFSRAPAIQLADLKKGDAVMAVATEDASGVTAITLMAGVEPLLATLAASQNLLNWSLSL